MKASDKLNRIACESGFSLVRSNGKKPADFYERAAKRRMWVHACMAANQGITLSHAPVTRDEVKPPVRHRKAPVTRAMCAFVGALSVVIGFTIGGALAPEVIGAGIANIWVALSP